ncbi:hypothetical protein [Pseudomonas sp. NMS19W]|uniref:hypothetical protein n=1 Tax=Pseudomonas sp. NMS19W TaxID=3079768 RepID=UPI003F657DCD
MTYSLYVNAGVVLAVSQALSPAIKKDVLDTVAFATLAADEDFPGELNDEQWFDTHSDMLTACGWSLFAQEMDQVPTVEGQSLSARAAIGQVAELRLPGHQTAVISAALEALASVSRRGELPERLGQHSLVSDAQTSWLRAMVGIVEDNGILSIVSVSFNTREQAGKGRVLPVSGRHATRRAYAARFNQDQFEAFRQDTIEWLAQEPQPACIEIGVFSGPM